MADAYRFTFPPFPIGWFQVAYSDELKPGEVKPLEYFGQKLVLFRTEAGVAHVLDAFCPHLGAHLGYGGKVAGDNIRCPFHAWEFDGGGTCKHVPYSDRVPEAAKVAPWPVHEVNGLIMVWHHPDRTEPAWTLPAIAEWDNEEWTGYHKRRWRVRSRNQEMAENAVDVAHFKYLHGTQNLPDPKMWTEGHQMFSQFDTEMMTPMGPATGRIEVEAHGFGFTLTRFFGFVETLLVNSVTAIDEEYLDVRFAFTVKKVGGADVTRGVAMAFIKEIERQLEQDVPIWENKRHVKPPILTDGDGPIARYRRWCKQFYADPNAQP